MAWKALAYWVRTVNPVFSKIIMIFNVVRCEVESTRPCVSRAHRRATDVVHRPTPPANIDHQQTHCSAAQRCGCPGHDSIRLYYCQELDTFQDLADRYNTTFQAIVDACELLWNDMYTDLLQQVKPDTPMGAETVVCIPIPSSHCCCQTHGNASRTTASDGSGNVYPRVILVSHTYFCIYIVAILFGKLFHVYSCRV